MAIPCWCARRGQAVLGELWKWLCGQQPVWLVPANVPAFHVCMGVCLASSLADEVAGGVCGGLSAICATCPNGQLPAICLSASLVISTYTWHALAGPALTLRGSRAMVERLAAAGGPTALTTWSWCPWTTCLPGRYPSRCDCKGCGAYARLWAGHCAAAQTAAAQRGGARRDGCVAHIGWRRSARGGLSCKVPFRKVAAQVCSAQLLWTQRVQDCAERGAGHPHAGPGRMQVPVLQG